MTIAPHLIEKLFSYWTALFLAGMTGACLAGYYRLRMLVFAAVAPGRCCAQRRVWDRRSRARRELLAELGFGRDDFPPMMGPVASADFLLLAARTVRQRRPSLVVEFGSGVSTLVVGRALQLAGHGKLISYDHHAGFAEKTRRDAAALGLPVEVRVTGLLPSADPRYPGAWYETPDLPDGIDMLVIDGPPKRIHAETRGLAGPAVFDRLAPDAVVLLDDASRPGERAVAKRWAEDFPDMLFTRLANDKGTLIGELAGAVRRQTATAA